MWYWVAFWIPDTAAAGFRDVGDTVRTGVTVSVSDTQAGPVQQYGYCTSVFFSRCGATCCVTAS